MKLDHRFIRRLSSLKTELASISSDVRKLKDLNEEDIECLADALDEAVDIMTDTIEDMAIISDSMNNHKR